MTNVLNGAPHSAGIGIAKPKEFLVELALMNQLSNEARKRTCNSVRRPPIAFDGPICELMQAKIDETMKAISTLRRSRRLSTRTIRSVCCWRG
jgi:hypothetical protein